MRKCFQRSNFPLGCFRLELLMEKCYVTLDMLTVKGVLGIVRELTKVCLVRFCGFGAKGFLFNAICDICADSFLQIHYWCLLLLFINHIIYLRAGFVDMHIFKVSFCAF